jgi:flagella basal body P-ring formation protein FlgA
MTKTPVFFLTSLLFILVGSQPLLANIIPSQSLLANSTPSQSIDVIEQTARNYVSTHLPTIGNARLEIAIGKIDSRLKLENCTEGLEAFSIQPVVTLQSSGIGVRCLGPKAWKVYLPIKISQWLPVVTALQSLPRNEALTAENIGLIEGNVANLNTRYYTSIDEVIGKISKQTLTAGNIVNSNQIQEAKLVRRGETVTLIARVGGLSVRSTGIAMADAVYGERVSVKNIDSKRVVDGTAQGQGLVQVDM